jgi:hypothetical protein
MRVNIEGHGGLVRDISSGAILNTNRTDYENFMMKQLRSKNQKELIFNQTEEINKLKDELDEIKQLLRSLMKENKCQKYL